MSAKQVGTIVTAVGVSAAAASGHWPGGPQYAAAAAFLFGLLFAGGLALWHHRRSRARAAAALQQRDRHLAATAHELRTPLTAIINSLEIVRGGYTTTLAEAVGFLDEADLAARHLAFLVNDVLDAAAMHAGRLRLELRNHPVDALLRQGLRVLGMQAARHDVRVDTVGGEGLRVRTDERRFLQVLFNLVGNAIKFAAPGHPVQVRVDALADAVCVRILDDGPGVPVDLRPSLFSPFTCGGQRGDGTGLGLCIAQQLVQQMGGAIGYRPRTPRGSEFWFTMPPAADVAVAPPAAAQP